MSDFKITAEWYDADDNDVIYKSTTASLSIQIDDIFLTQNTDGWTQSVQNSIRVSTYPLAKWFAYYWWRLENEYLIVNGRKPDFNWRCAHELGAANHGYVWPKVLFVSDGQFINIWSDTIPTPLQSVNYIGKLDSVYSVPMESFQNAIGTLINDTIFRLSGVDADLLDLWTIVSEERNNPKISNIRKLEAVLGYDPEECPDELMNRVLVFQKQVGQTSIKELAPFLLSDTNLQQHLQTEKGIESIPQVKQDQITIDRNKDYLPWQQGVSAARQLRRLCDFGDDLIESKKILDLLGIASKNLSSYNNTYSSEIPVSVGRNESDGKWIIIPSTKKAETSKRFELSRLLGDYLLYKDSDQEWLIASDYKSFRQKAQRAFAAEFLCPIFALDRFLNNDYSETKREKAASYFQVSNQTIDSLLLNNGRIGRENKGFPYSA